MIKIPIYNDEKEYEKEFTKRLKDGTLETFCPLIKEKCKGLECVLFQYGKDGGNCYLHTFLHDTWILASRVIEKHYPIPIDEVLERK